MIPFKTPSLSGDNTELSGRLWISRTFLEKAAGRTARPPSSVGGTQENIESKQSTSTSARKAGSAESETAAAPAEVITTSEGSQQCGVQGGDKEEDTKRAEKAMQLDRSRWWESASWERGWSQLGPDDGSLQTLLPYLRTGHFPLVVLVHQYSLMGGRR